jgi:hypothetical protein
MDFTSRDTAYLQAGVPELKEYLLSRQTYWPVSARGYDLPRLTLGGLLLASRRLAAVSAPVESLVTQMEAVRSSWRVAWEDKAQREFKARFRLWKDYLMETREAPEEVAGAYPHEVRYRVMLQLLDGELPVHPEEYQALAALDEVLGSILTPGPFVWESELQEAFPSGVYWYLYGKLSTKGATHE